MSKKNRTLDKARYFKRITAIKSRHAPSSRFTGSLRNLYDTVIEIVAEDGIKRLGFDAISKRYKEKYHISQLSILPTDVCYNMVNLEDQETKFLMCRGIGDFEFVGLNYVNDREERITWTLRGRDLPERLKNVTYNIGTYRNGNYSWNEDELKRLNDDILRE